ncbi:transcriptional regulator [Xenorhabdus sp. TS4]|uniref:transcriptional regulator n=1 Tax=Xenorhabdus sp. TS4 TaxID=1873483 RepID=UPI0016571CEC|nr:transcriptional regulator [Xenorhabdus sp. TS4]MBC8950229.1 hypothetical protein [Xenorhabdus sp. TS4]
MSEIKHPPVCPKCSIEGIEHIYSSPSEKQSKAGDPWFEVAHCTKCGHVYGVFAKIVYEPTVPFIYK